MTNFTASTVNAFQNKPQATLGGFSAVSASADGYSFDMHLSDSLASDQSAGDTAMNMAASRRPSNRPPSNRPLSNPSMTASQKPEANNPPRRDVDDMSSDGDDNAMALNDGRATEAVQKDGSTTGETQATDARPAKDPDKSGVAATDDVSNISGQNEPVAAKIMALGQNLVGMPATGGGNKAEAHDDKATDDKAAGATDEATDISPVDPLATSDLLVSPVVVAPVVTAQIPAATVADDTVMPSAIDGAEATPEQLKALRAKLEESDLADSSSAGSPEDAEGVAAAGAEIPEIDGQRFSQLLGDAKAGSKVPTLTPAADDAAVALSTAAETLKAELLGKKPDAIHDGGNAAAPSGPVQTNNAQQNAGVGGSHAAQGSNAAAADPVAASTSGNNADAGALPVGTVAGQETPDTSVSNPLPFATLGIGGSASGHMAVGVHGVERGPLSSQQPYVAAQVGMQITKTVSEGGDHFSIRLDPAELGRVEVKLHFLGDGKVTAAVSADNQQTLDLLQRDSRSLDRALQDAGLRTDSGSLSFSLRQQGQQQQPSFSSGNFGRGGGRENIDDTATAENAAASRSYVSNRALDITV